MANIITITGTVGCGKSTTAKMLAAQLGYEYYYGGMAYRKIAESRGLTVNELLAMRDPKVDEEVDTAFTKLPETGKNYVVEGRVAFHFIPASFKVMLVAAPEIAAGRVLNDQQRKGEKKYCDKGEAMAALAKRRELEMETYQRLYNLSIEDKAHFDIIVDTSRLTPDDVCARILSAFEKWKNKK